MKKIDLDMERCCACGACAIACMDQNNIEPEEGMRPFRTVFRDDWEEDGKAQYFSIACMHCDNAPCVLACPVGCIYKDAQTGYTLFDNTNCIGCHSCAMACPFGAPAFGKDGKCTNAMAVLNVSMQVWSRHVSVPVHLARCRW